MRYVYIVKYMEDGQIKRATINIRDIEWLIETHEVVEISEPKEV